MVGKQLVDLLLKSDRFSEVKVLVRRPLGIEHSRLTEIIYDFSKPDPLLLKADVLFCCLGTTLRKAGSMEAFRQVDEVYPLQIARAGLDSGASSFHIVTAMGAKASSLFFYNSVKGEVEDQLKSMGYHALHIYRPSLLTGERKEKRTGERIGAVVMSILQPLFLGPLRKYRAIDSAKVARAMYELSGHSSGGIFVHESDELQQY